MGDANLTQQPALVLLDTDPDSALTQQVVLVLCANGPGTGPIRVSGVVAESANQYGAVPTRVSGVEVESAQQYGDPPVRVSGVPLESVYQYSAAPTRVSGVEVEVGHQYSAAPMRLSQVVVEILRPLSCETQITPELPTTEPPVGSVSPENVCQGRIMLLIPEVRTMYPAGQNRRVTGDNDPRTLVPNAQRRVILATPDGR